VQIIIEDGAFFKGSIEIEKSAKGDKNEFSRTPSAAASDGPKSI
jgi:hypothetical protein